MDNICVGRRYYLFDHCDKIHEDGGSIARNLIPVSLQNKMHDVINKVKSDLPMNHYFL